MSRLLILIFLMYSFSLSAQKTKEKDSTIVETNFGDSNLSKELPDKTPITVNQYFSNNVAFRGFSVLGDILSKRDNKSLTSMPLLGT